MAPVCHSNPLSFSPKLFPPIERHGIIGDRRTGALVSADGTVDWFCTPEYDGESCFSLLLDMTGGYCRFAPYHSELGAQSYQGDTAVLLTKWPNEAGGEVELADVMAWPDEARASPNEAQRVILRRVRAQGRARIGFELCAARGLAGDSGAFFRQGGGAVCALSKGRLGLWCSFDFDVEAGRAAADFTLEDGEEHWCVVGWNLDPQQWSRALARETFDAASKYWREWSAALQFDGAAERTWRVCRSAITVQLLGHARSDCVVAALTTSLPERVGGDRNYDYRYAWVRDASLAMALLARLGKNNEVQRYFDWLCKLPTCSDAPLMVCYKLDGTFLQPEVQLRNLAGYRQSLPVRIGNRASRQKQHGSLGFLADCARLYLEHGGAWKESYGKLLHTIADYTCEHWREPDSGVWELQEQFDFVGSRVMSWTVLDRAIKIASRTGQKNGVERWRAAAAEIHSEVLERGWSSKKGAFRQRYDSDALDAAALLIPLMEFLPATDERVLSTLDAMERELVVDGLIHRFKPEEILPGNHPPLGEFEGAFLPAVFWHAHALAKARRLDQADSILRRCELVSGQVGLFAEELQTHGDYFLGNMPLVFAHVEYVRALLALRDAAVARSAIAHSH